MMCQYRFNRARSGTTLDLQHAIRLVPMQIMLNIHGGFGLDGETNEAQQQECSGICIALPGRGGGGGIVIDFSEGGGTWGQCRAGKRRIVAALFVGSGQQRGLAIATRRRSQV